MPAYGTIVPVRLSPLAAGNPIFVGSHPSTIALTPNGGTAYVTNPSTRVIDVVNLASGVVEPPIAGVTDPQGIAMAPDGQRAYVSAGDNVVSSVVPIDLTTGRALAPIAVDSPSAGYLAGPIAVSPDGRTAYTTNLESGCGSAQVSILSTASNKLIAQLGGFSAPAGIALVGRTHTLYVLNVVPSRDGGISSGRGRSAIDVNALVPSILSTAASGCRCQYRLLLVRSESRNPDQSTRARLTPSAGDRDTV